MQDDQQQNAPYIPEHGGAPTDAQKPDEMGEDERKVVQLAERLFTKAKRARASFDRDWMDFVKYFRGDQWKEKRPAYRHSEVLNFVQSSIRNIVPLVTDPRPTVEVSPQDPTDYDFAQILNQVISSKWETGNYNFTTSEAVVDALVTGTACAAVEQHDDLLDGLGDFVFETEDVNYIYPDPNARDVNDRFSKFFCIAKPTDMQEVLKEYPKLKGKIKPDLTDVANMNAYAETESFQFKSPTDNRVLIPDAKSFQHGNPDLVLKLTVYIKDDTVDTRRYQEECKETGDILTIEETVKKYPNGRKIVVIGGRLAEDDELRYEDGKFPYARLANDQVPRQFWGDSEVKHLKSPQDIINKFISYILDYLVIVGNPTWIVDTESGIDTDNLTNEPGLVIEKKKGSEAQRIPGVSIPPYMMQTLQYFVDSVFSKINGAQDVSQGFVQKSDMSGEAIGQLMEAAQTRMRAKQRNIDAFMQDVGELMVSRILQYYNAPRIMRLTGRGDVPRYFKFGVSVGEDGIRTAETQEWVTADGAGYWTAPEQMTLKSALDVRITTGSSLPLQKAKTDAQAERFFDKDIIDAEDLLEIINYPKREKIIEKWKARQAAEAQAAQQAAMAKAGGRGAASMPPLPPPQ